MALHAGASALIALCLAGPLAAVQAAGIYRCEIDGVTTFVDSPRNCPAGASRIDGARDAQGSAAGGGAGPHTVTAKDVPCQQRFGENPALFRECLRGERRAEVRRIASLRLAALSAAVREFAGSPLKEDGLIAIGKKGRSPEWCTDILNDVIAMKNLEVIDDESPAGPEWMNLVNADGKPRQLAAPVLDEDFKEWRLDAGTVAHGYVTARWRGSNVVVLRVLAACTQADDGTARCNPQPYISVIVNDGGLAVACHASFIGRAYWPNWKDSMTPIRLNALRRPTR